MTETFTEFLERTVNGEEARHEVGQKFKDTFREVTETLAKARRAILDLIEQRDKANARFSSLLEIGPVATERERCAKLLQHYGIEEDRPLLDILKLIKNGDEAPC